MAEHARIERARAGAPIYFPSSGGHLDPFCSMNGGKPRYRAGLGIAYEFTARIGNFPSVPPLNPPPRGGVEMVPQAGLEPAC